MKIQGSKKNALIVLVVFISVLAIVLAIILYSTFAKKYPEKPILMKNLGKTEQSIDISSLEIKNEVNDVSVYFIEPKIHITLVEQMIDKMGISLNRTDTIPNSYIEWSDGENEFTYDSVSDSVTFQLKREISVDRGEQSFIKVFEKYLGLTYEFKLVGEKKDSDGGITYYGARLLDGIEIEYGAEYEYSDILKFDKKGNLVSGQLLLAQIDKYDVYLPLISKNELNKYINTKGYPKEQYANTEILADILNLNYLDEKWQDIEDSLKDCKAQSSELIFMYKTSNQGYLLPVYKIASNCTVTNENQEYTVPVIFYVNAADPRYVTL